MEGYREPFQRGVSHVLERRDLLIRLANDSQL